MFIKIEVAHGGKSYNVRPYHEVPEALKLKYESEEDTLLKNLALAKVFKGNLNDPIDWYSFDGLEHYEQILLANEWLRKSNAIESMKEEPDIVY